MRRAALFGLLFLAGGSAFVWAADQTVTIDTPPQFLSTEASKLLHVEDATLPPENARALIESTLGRAVLDNPDFYCMIHILAWKDDQTTIQAENWYLYHPGKWSRTDFSRLRIFGSENVALLYIHLNARGQASGATLSEDLSRSTGDVLALQLATRELLERKFSNQAQIDAEKDEAKRGALMEQAKQDRIKTLKSRTTSDLAGELARGILEDLKSGAASYVSQTGRRVTLLGEGYVEDRYPGIVYKVEVTKKLPAPIQSLNALIGALQGEKVEKVAPVRRVDLWGGRTMTINYIPSDISVHALVAKEQGKDPTEVSTKTYDNEGRYRWDVSVGVPVNKLKELEYNADDGTVRAKTIDKQNVFAFLNLFVKPVDLNNPKEGLVPRALIGVSISSRPLDRVFFGGGLGINKVQFFAGLVINKVQSPASLQSGSTATSSQLGSDLRTRYDKKFLMGLNVPVRQVVNALKAKK